MSSGGKLDALEVVADQPCPNPDLRAVPPPLHCRASVDISICLPSVVKLPPKEALASGAEMHTFGQSALGLPLLGSKRRRPRESGQLDSLRTW